MRVTGERLEDEEGAGPRGGAMKCCWRPGFVPEAADEGDAAEEGAGGGDEGEEKEIGEPAEEGRGGGAR